MYFSFLFLGRSSLVGGGGFVIHVQDVLES